MTQPRRPPDYIGRGTITSVPRPPRTRGPRDRLRDLSRRLNDRDRWLLAMLAEHRVLTTNQITRIGFATGTAARHRMYTLHTLGVVERFRPPAPTGSAPWHYTLAPTGAALLAHSGTADPAATGYRPGEAGRLATSTHLAHTVAVNEFFVGLIATARNVLDCELTTWWGERRCAQAWKSIVRPDGYGEWSQTGARVTFFAEIDRGTESLDRLLRKVDAYTDLAHASGIMTPVLFSLPSPQREHALHERLGYPAIPVATTNPKSLDCCTGPADRIWRHPAVARR